MQRLTSGAGLPRWAASAGTRGMVVALAVVGEGCWPSPANPAPEPPADRIAASIVIESPPGTRRPPFRFDADDERLLDEIQHAAFQFLWHECSPKTGMVVDRSSVTFASIAGVGFQLAALPIGVERGWVGRSEAQQRAERILRALAANPRNRKEGMFHHFLDADRADPVGDDAVSTVDSALFFAGAIVAASYFGGDVQRLADQFVADANWAFFVEQSPRPHEPHMKGMISLGWKPKDKSDPSGAGALLPYYWADSGDEHRLVAFLAAAAPNASHRVDASVYYRLRRPLGDYPGVPEHVYLPWSGALFTDFFANCFINYASMGPDDPSAIGVERRPRVDWWENSRRAVMLHRAKAIEAHATTPNLGPTAWGLTACDGPKGYLVPGVYPTSHQPSDYRADLDYPKFSPKDDLAGGIVAPYGAGCAILFDPVESLAALRNYRTLKAANGELLSWHPPGGEGRREYGFRDSFDASGNWTAPDYVSIDQGPLVLAIENARTGRVWNWFHGHPTVQVGVERLKWGRTKP